MTALEFASMTIELPLTLRIATKKDLPALEWYGQYTHYRNLFRRAFREQRRGNRLMLLADCRDFPIGYIFIRLDCKNKNHWYERYKRAHLYSFRVMEMFQGQGIGTRLIREAETIATERGFYSTTIAVAKENAQARRLYERLGYLIIGENSGHWSYLDHKGRIRRIHEPCWLLQKTLDVE